MFILTNFNFPPPQLNYALSSILKTKFANGNIIKWHDHASHEAMVAKQGSMAVPESSCFWLCTLLSDTIVLQCGMAMPESTHSAQETRPFRPCRTLSAITSSTELGFKWFKKLQKANSEGYKFYEDTYTKIIYMNWQKCPWSG